MKIDGRLIASEILDGLKPRVEELKKEGIMPTLAVLLIGNNQSSKSYIKQKQLKAEEIGAEIKLMQFDSSSEAELVELINKLNNDDSIHGIIVQRPLPGDFDRDLVSKSIKPEKDVDGFNPNSNFETPVGEAVVEILTNIGEADLTDKKIVVIGKGETAGGPTIKVLNKHGIHPVVVDHSTPNPDELVKNADIIISAVGKEKVVGPSNLNKNQILIGIGLFSNNGKLKGDYEESEVENKVKFYTPTIGGVGPVNVACLMKNLVQAAKLSHSIN